MAKRKVMIGFSSSVMEEDPNVLACVTTPMGSICARWIDGFMLAQEIIYSEKKRRDYLTGTSAVLFVHSQEDEGLDEAKQRLFNLINCIPRIPGKQNCIDSILTFKNSRELAFEATHF
jgi:hypothetical protein